MEFEGDVEHSPESQTLPVIAYDLVRRTVSEKRAGLKPRLFQEMPDPDDPSYRLSVYRQWFDCVVRFHCIHSSRRKARELAESFEQFLQAWTGYFKDLGVSEILFDAELPPSVKEQNRQRIVTRSLQYLVVYQRVNHVKNKALDKIFVKVVEPIESEHVVSLDDADEEIL